MPAPTTAPAPDRSKRPPAAQKHETRAMARVVVITAALLARHGADLSEEWPRARLIVPGEPYAVLARQRRQSRRPLLRAHLGAPLAMCGSALLLWRVVPCGCGRGDPGCARPHGSKRRRRGDRAPGAGVVSQNRIAEGLRPFLSIDQRVFERCPEN